MSTADRMWAVVQAACCSAGVAGYVSTGSPPSAGFATFMGLMFFGFLLDRRHARGSR